MTWAATLKKCAVLPGDARLADEPYVSLVDERGGLQRVVGPLAPQVVVGRSPQLLIDEREQRVERRQFDKAFVLMQYYGYLRRNPPDPPDLTLDFRGYNFWLTKLNNLGGNYINAEMVKAFITSFEYQERFGPR